MLWNDGSVPFPCGKGGSSVLANCSFGGIEDTRENGLFQQAQYAQVFLLKSAPFCKLFAGQQQQVCHFSFYLTLTLSSPPYPLLHFFFYLNRSGSSGRNCLLSFPVLLGYNGSLDTRFSRGMTRLMSWPDRERYLYPLQSLVVSLLSCIHFSFFSDWRRTVPSKFFDTQVLSISTEELVPPRHARCVFSRLCYNGHSLLLSSYLFRIGRIENRSCSACRHLSQDTSHLILLCLATHTVPLALWRLSVSL